MAKSEEEEHVLHVSSVNLHRLSMRCREREYFLMFFTAHYGTRHVKPPDFPRSA